MCDQEKIYEVRGTIYDWGFFSIYDLRGTIYDWGSFYLRFRIYEVDWIILFVIPKSFTIRAS